MLLPLRVNISYFCLQGASNAAVPSPVAGSSTSPNSTTRSSVPQSPPSTPVTSALASETNAKTVTASRRKLELFRLYCSESACNDVDLGITDTPSTSACATESISDFSYRMVSFTFVVNMVASLACPHCLQTKLHVRESLVYGLASKLQACCAECDEVVFSEFTCPTLTNGPAYDSNNRFVYACKANGLGYEQACSFFADMNLPKPIVVSKFTNKVLSLAASCARALADHFKFVHHIVRSEYVKTGSVSADEPVVDIAVSYDGTWQKRGHTSKNGIGVAIDLLTGLVVDFCVLSNFCIVCERGPDNKDDGYAEFWTAHKDECVKNHDGSSNSMEVAAAKVIWARSSNSGLHYTTMLSDGDSKAFDAVMGMKPYGDKAIKKEECLNHVAKRLTTGLNNLIAARKKQNLPAGGKGLLTQQTLIPTLHSYYHKAIKQHAGNVSEMRREILAAPYHITSTDESPQHQYCPSNSWCWYKNPEKPQGHHPDLPLEMLKVILPVYERLSQPFLLERCARVATQNANECLNGEIWRRCPKTQWYGRRSIEIGAAMAVMSFNGAGTELFSIQEDFGLHAGTRTQAHAQKKRQVRLARAPVSSGLRKSRKHRQVTARQRQVQKEGVTYAAGKFGA